MKTFVSCGPSVVRSTGQSLEQIVKPRVCDMSNTKFLWSVSGCYISMSSSSPEPGVLLELRRSLWGDGEGQGVGGSCLHALWTESFTQWLNGSSGGRHSTSSMHEWLTDWATVCGRMSLIPLCSPSFRLSDSTSTGLRGHTSTSRSRSESESSSRVILSSISRSLCWAASISIHTAGLFVLVQAGGVSVRAGLRAGGGHADEQLSALSPSTDGWGAQLSHSAPCGCMRRRRLALHTLSSPRRRFFLRHLISHEAGKSLLFGFGGINWGPRSNSSGLEGTQKGSAIWLTGAEWCIMDLQLSRLGVSRLARACAM